MLGRDSERSRFIVEQLHGSFGGARHCSRRPEDRVQAAAEIVPLAQASTAYLMEEPRGLQVREKAFLSSSHKRHANAGDKYEKRQADGFLLSEQEAVRLGQQEVPSDER